MSPPSSRCWLTLSTAGACRATSQVERLNSSAANSVAGAVSVRDGVEGIALRYGFEPEDDRDDARGGAKQV